MIEEYGVTFLKREFLGYDDIINGSSHWVAFCFKVLVEEKDVRIIETDKVDQIKWFNLNEFPKNLHFYLPTLIKKFRDKL